MLIVPSEKMTNPEYSIELKESLLGQYRLALLKNKEAIRVSTTYQKSTLLKRVSALKDAADPEKAIAHMQ